MISINFGKVLKVSSNLLLFTSLAAVCSESEVQMKINCPQLKMWHAKFGSSSTGVNDVIVKDTFDQSQVVLPEELKLLKLLHYNAVDLKDTITMTVLSSCIQKLQMKMTRHLS
jgi:hypothetical protein